MTKQLSLDECRKRPHWSYSSLNQLLNICSLQWAFQRVYRVNAAFTPVCLSFGSAYHRTMEWIGMNRMQGRIPSATDAQDVFTDMWERQVQEERSPVNYKQGESADSIAEQGRGLIACFVEHIDPQEEVLAVNYTFSVPLVTSEGATLSMPFIGEIDAVYRKGDQVLLIDWKTAARRWSVSQVAHHLQPTAMLYGYYHDTGTMPHFRFDVMVKNKTPVFECCETTRGADDLARLVSLVERAESIVSHGLYYPAEQCNYCSGCAFQEPCKRWHRSGENDEVGVMNAQREFRLAG